MSPTTAPTNTLSSNPTNFPSISPIQNPTINIPKPTPTKQPMRTVSPSINPTIMKVWNKDKNKKRKRRHSVNAKNELKGNAQFKVDSKYESDTFWLDMRIIIIVCAIFIMFLIIIWLCCFFERLKMLNGKQYVNENVMAIDNDISDIIDEIGGGNHDV
eukprot:63398_1